MTTQPEFIQLNQFTGTKHVYLHDRDMLFTDGIRYLAEKYECCWLINDIAIFSEKFREQERFMVVKLFERKRAGKPEWVFQLTDAHDQILYQDTIIFSTITVNVKLFLVLHEIEDQYMLMLPSEN